MMIKATFTTISRFTPELVKKFLRPIKYNIDLKNSIRVPILPDGSEGEIVQNIKKENIEYAFFPKVYDFFIGGELGFKCPELNIIKYSNAKVFYSSDYLLLEKGALWHKFHLPQFTKSLPQDRNLLRRENNTIFIKRSTEVINVKNGFSLCGVYSDVWAHFLIQFLPKLYLLSEIKKHASGIVTVIIPDYKDAHIREIVFEYLSGIEGIEILELRLAQTAACETLFHLDNTAYIMDTAKYISPCDVIAPAFVSDLLKENLVNKYLPSFATMDTVNPEKGLKLYISRTGGRNVLNNSEIEAYFKEKGFIFVSPHKLSFREKVKLFSQADCVAGPCSSGFMNVIFCRPKTKMLSFINFSRVFESYFGFISKYFEIDILLVTGIDQYSEEINSSYIVPLEKIKSACTEFGI